MRLEASDLGALRAAAQELGLTSFDINLGPAMNVPGFIEILKRGLDFPDWAGDNLDALYDGLTDLSWQPARGYIIILTGAEALRANPTSFAVFNEVLASAVDEWKRRGIPFWVFYCSGDGPTPDKVLPSVWS
jgi:Barstar (barnase inhibitor)